MKARPHALSRRAAERRGRIGEWAAALMLTLKGFAIIARRFRAPAGEIDLIARRGRLLVFVEVKAHASHDAAIEAVTPRARRRIGAAARSFLARKRHLANCDMRYDIVTMVGWRLRHLPDAWRDTA